MRGLATAVRLGPAAGGPRLDLAAAVAPVKRMPSELPVAARADDAAPERYALLGGHGAVPGPLA